MSLLRALVHKRFEGNRATFNNKHPTEFLLGVRNGHSNAPVAHALHPFPWEILEDPDLWQDVFQAKHYNYTNLLPPPCDHVANTVSSYNLYFDLIPN